MERTISNLLNDDVLGLIKSFLYLNITDSLIIEEAQFMMYINSLKDKELKKICKEKKIKQSSGQGVCNSYIKRMNIIKWKFSRELTHEERLLINHLNYTFNPFNVYRMNKIVFRKKMI